MVKGDDLAINNLSVFACYIYVNPYFDLLLGFQSLQIALFTFAC